MAKTTIKQRIALDGGKELKRELEEFGAAGRKAFKELQDAAAQTKGLSPGFFNSLKQAEVQLKSLAQSFNEAGKAIQNVGRTLTTSLTLPIVGVGAGILKVSGDFQKAMNSFAVNAGVAGTALEDARAKAKELGVASVFSTTEAAEGMTELAKVGLDFQTIMGGAARAMVDLAAANDTGLASSASVVGDVINQFKLSASQLPAIVDQITGATIESKLSFDDYRLAIGQAGGAAGALGVQFEEFNAVIAATASSFASGSDAGTSFKTFLTRLVPQSKQAAAMMEKLGLKFFDASGKMKSMSQIAQELQTKLGNLSQEDLNDAVSTIFGTDALRTAIALMRQGGKGIDDMMAKLKNTDSAEIAATRVKGFNGELGKLIEAFNNLGIAIGDSGFLDFATNIVIKLTEWTEQLAKVSPEMLKLSTIIGGLAAAIGPLLLGLGLMTRAFGVTLQGVAALVGGFRLLSGALLFLGANPIIAALALIGATIAIWATRADEATAALRVHEDLIGKVGNAYDQAGRKVGEMTQQLKDQALIAARQSQDVAQKALPDAIDEAINKIEQFDGLLPHAADGLFDLFKQFKDTKDIEAFREAVASIGAQSPELGNLAQQFLDITKPAHDLNVSLQESLNWIGLYTGKINDSQFASKQAALGLAGWSDANKKAAEDVKAVGAAVDETKTKVEALGKTIEVFRGGGASGITKQTFDVINGVARAVDESKKSIDDLGSATQDAGASIDNTITNSIKQIAPAAQEAAAGFSSALGGLDAGAAQQAAGAMVAPFETLPGKFSEILNGIRALLQGGFANLNSIVTSLAAQIQSAIARILASLRAAAAAASALRAQAAGSSSASSSGGSQGGFAGGGFVRGPGGPRTDSILARLSNGEFVIQARAVQRLGVDFLNLLNQGIVPNLKGLRGFKLGGFVDGFNQSMSIPRLADGGMVSKLAPAGIGGATGLTTVRLDFGLGPGDVFDLIGEAHVARKLQNFAVKSGLLTTGRKPRRG
ncbi:MAG: phage tail tape measure protein [Mesorhizobium sp.]|uniref:phage tail tape measure protein n=1 Tax=Mesorhizobium sp. TaxID=1871066 RepID=UPI001220D1B7|nr:phage tail tape measure protein [Mesorhizobium sp.]TIL94521.1 MAG: phage tail tape measure protein [Mesorhizobium sp.]